MIYINSEKPNIQLNHDTDFIKLIAAFAMFCDHFGKIFYNNIIILQIIGRIAFPIFAYCIAVGTIYTCNIKKYMLRLGIVAFISQPLYIMAFVPNWSDPLIFIQYKNALFSLLIGLIGIYSLREKKWLLLVLCAVIARFAKIDYGIYGFLLILSFYLFIDNRYKSLLIVTALMVFRFTAGRQINALGLTFGIQGLSLLSLPFIYCRTNFNIKINKYFFYVFYPAHLLVFIIIHMLS